MTPGSEGMMFDIWIGWLGMIAGAVCLIVFAVVLVRHLIR